MIVRFGCNSTSWWTPACFALSFWAAYALRNDPQIIAWLHLPAISDETLDSQKLLWLSVVLIPAAPLILESQNFYNRLPLCPRRAILWPLFKGCVITTIGLVLAMYVFHFVTPRGMMAFFGVISFSVVYAEGRIGALGVAQQTGSIAIQAPLRPRRHGAGNCPDAAGIKTARSATASRSWPNSISSKHPCNRS